MLGCIKRVRVYDNYARNIKPALYLKNKIRYILGVWMPIGGDSPFGRLVFVKGHAVECGTPIVKHGRLSDMGKNFTMNGKEYLWTHWQESK